MHIYLPIILSTTIDMGIFYILWRMGSGHDYGNQGVVNYEGEITV